MCGQQGLIILSFVLLFVGGVCVGRLWEIRGRLEVTTQPPRRLPMPGERWQLASKMRGPWEPTGGGYVKILDQREGWVRYSLSEFFSDERMKLDTFLYCYRPTNGT